MICMCLVLKSENSWDPGSFVELVFSARLRDSKSREKVSYIMYMTYVGVYFCTTIAPSLEDASSSLSLLYVDTRSFQWSICRCGGEIFCGPAGDWFLHDSWSSSGIPYVAVLCECDEAPCISVSTDWPGVSAERPVLWCSKGGHQEQTSAPALPNPNFGGTHVLR